MHKMKSDIKTGGLSSQDIFPGIYSKCRCDSGSSHAASDRGRNRIYGALCYDICRLCISKRSDIFQPLGLICQIGNDIQKIQDCRQAQTDPDPVSSQARRDAEADGGDFNLKKEISPMKKKELFDLKPLADNAGHCKSSQNHGGVEDHDLQENAQ